MKIISLVALLAVGACCALGFEVAAPPQLQALTPMEASRVRARQQLEEAVKLGLSAPASASISTSFFNRVLADVDAYINAVGTSITIPGMDEKHFGFDSFKFSQFTIGAISITTTAPNLIVVSISNVGIIVPETNFHVKADKWIHCAGQFGATIEGGNFAITLAMGNDGAGHVTTVATVVTSYATLNIHHKFDHTLCKIANDIINDLIGNIDKIIDKVVKQDLPGLLGPGMTKSFDAMFTKIPLYFVGAPVVVGQGISVTVDLLASAVAATTATGVQQTLQQKLKDLSHDITISVPASSINNIVSVAQQAGKLKYDLKLAQTTSYFKSLIPAAYSACPDCKLDLVLDLDTAPSVTFATDDIDATANAVDIAINAVNTSTGAIVPLFAINVNMTLDVDNVTVRVQADGINNLYFQLAVKTLSITLGATSVGPLPLINIIGDLLSSLVKDLAVPAFDAAFQGFDFPTLFGGMQVSALDGVFVFETNILVPPISVTN